MLAFTPNEASVNTPKVKTQNSLNTPLILATSTANETPTRISSSSVDHIVEPSSVAIKPAIADTLTTQTKPNEEVELVKNTNNPSFNGNWRALVDALKLGLARELAKHCELVAYDEDSITLSVPESQKHLVSANYQEKLTSAITQHFDRKIKLLFSIGGTGNTPAKQIHQEKAQAQANAESAIEEDSFVQALIDDFGATIIPNSIKPI